MYDKYLPVGTVVLLKDASKKLMITGFCVAEEEKSNTIYDYCGCLYPEGYINSKENALFNHNQISKIYYMGFQDEEGKEFKSKLIEFMNNQNK